MSEKSTESKIQAQKDTLKKAERPVAFKPEVVKYSEENQKKNKEQ